MAEELIAHYSGDTPNEYTLFHHTSSEYWGYGQRFYLADGVSRKLTRVEFQLSAWTATSPGACTIEVFLCDGSGIPTGAAIATASLNGSELTDSAAWYSKTLSPQPTITGTGESTRWAICIRGTGADWPMSLSQIRWHAKTGTGNGEVNYSGNIKYDVDTWSGENAKSTGTKIYGEPVVPGKPTNPSPSDTASNITLDESPLTWDASNPAADTYEIYFREQGESWDLIGVAQAGVEYVLDFGILDYNITYEWRIDATNTTGTTTGDTWTFDSIVFNTILPGTSGGGGGGGGGGGSGEESSPSGENNMLTLRRLVTAANSKIFYEDI